MTKKFLLPLLLVLGFVFGGCGNEPKDDGKIKIVTSFYPIYIDAINVAGNIPGVEVVNLTAPQTGCLHDYQLTTENLKTLENADIFITNGLGMENFIDKVTAERKDLKIIDASKGIDPIEENGEVNPHVWMSVTYSMAQVKNIISGLCEIDPDNAEHYRKNGLEYVNSLTTLRDDMHMTLDILPNKDIVTFHEAFPYFAKEFKLNIVGVIEHEPGTEPTPQELAETIEKVNSLPVKVIFTEPQYSPKAAETVATETGAGIYTLDPIVTGDAVPENADAYLNTMLQNMMTLLKALN